MTTERRRRRTMGPGSDKRGRNKGGARRPRGATPPAVTTEPPAVEDMQERRDNPTEPKEPLAGSPMGVLPPDSPPPPRDGGGGSGEGPNEPAPGNKILTQDVMEPSEESIQPGEKTSSGVLGFFKRVAAKATNPQYTLFETMGLPKLRIETENEMGRIDREIMDRTFGDTDFKKLGDWFRENPEGAQIPRKIREAGGTTAKLSAYEGRLYRSNKPMLDSFMFGEEGAHHGFFRLLDETRQVGLAEGDLGPNYYPRVFRSIGDLLRLREDMGADTVKKIVNGNLELSRESRMIPTDTPTETASYYVSQVKKALRLQPEIERVKGLIKDLDESGRGQDAGLVRQWLKSNVMNEVSDLDATLRDSKFEGILDEQTPRGSKFTSSGALGPAGEIEVVRQVGESRVKSGRDSAGKQLYTTEPLYEVKVDGQVSPVRYNRLELLASKYAEAALDRAPLSRIIDKANRVSAWLTIATNTRSFIRSSIANSARILSGSMGFSDMVQGGRQAAAWLRRAVPEETLKEWRDVGVLDLGMEQITGEALQHTVMSVADTVAFANVWFPDQLARIVSYEMGKSFYEREGGDISPQRVRTAATHYATTVSDLMRKGARSPLSFDPLMRTVSFLSNATLREAQQFWDQLSKHQYASAAANVGVRAASLYAVYRFAGVDDPKKALRELAGLIPWSWIATGQGMPAMDIPAGYAANAVKAAGIATGLKRANVKEQDAVMRKLAPLSILRNQEPKDFLVSPRS